MLKPLPQGQPLTSPSMMTVNALTWDTQNKCGAVVPITVCATPSGQWQAVGRFETVGPMGVEMIKSAGLAVTAAHHVMAEKLGTMFPPREIIVSVPEQNEVMFDGPSAGLAIFLAALGASLKWASIPRVAVSGEIKSDGSIVKVRKIVQKIDAAAEQSIDLLFIPKSNADDLAKQPMDVKKWGPMTIVGVSHASEMLTLEESYNESKFR